MTFYRGVNKDKNSILRDMIHLWRMHKFARLTREQTKVLNGDIDAAIRGDKVIDPRTDRVTAAFKCKRKKSLRRFTDNEVAEIYTDMIEDKYCTSLSNKNVTTLHLEKKGKRLSEFMGYIEELRKNRKRSVELVITVGLSTTFVLLIQYIVHLTISLWP